MQSQRAPSAEEGVPPEPEPEPETGGTAMVRRISSTERAARERADAATQALRAGEPDAGAELQSTLSGIQNSEGPRSGNASTYAASAGEPDDVGGSRRFRSIIDALPAHGSHIKRAGAFGSPRTDYSGVPLPPGLRGREFHHHGIYLRSEDPAILETEPLGSVIMFDDCDAWSPVAAAEGGAGGGGDGTKAAARIVKVPYRFGEAVIVLDYLDGDRPYDREQAAVRAQGYCDRNGEPEEGTDDPSFRPGEYDAYRKNCEHFANFCATKNCVSRQAEETESTLLAGGGGALAGWLAARVGVYGAGAAGLGSTAALATPAGAAVGGAVTSTVTAMGVAPASAAGGGAAVAGAIALAVANPIVTVSLVLFVPTAIAIKQRGGAERLGEPVNLLGPASREHVLTVDKHWSSYPREKQSELRGISVSNMALRKAKLGSSWRVISTCWYDYILTFTSHSSHSFAFEDEAGDVYKITCYVNGQHAIMFDSKRPSIVKVTRF
jgi:hypothetical protein